MISTTQLQLLALTRQGLTHNTTFGKGLAGTQRAIEHLGYVQIDTLAVVERAHHHILWSRVPDYQPDYLDQLVRNRDVFEYWLHAASYLPMRDYRFSLPRMNSVKTGTHQYFSKIDPKLMREILARVKADGPIRVRDLKADKTEQGSWWNWGPGKRALEKLFMQGDLMVLERNGMEKIYDLAEKILPSTINTKEPSLAEYSEYLINNAIKAHGIFTWKQLTHLITNKPLKEALRKNLDEKIDQKIITELNTSQFPSSYVDTTALITTEHSTQKSNGLFLLSPFDNAVIHRERLEQLFGFNYRIECYVPAPKRVFGYFCLPILYKGKFVGRVDCKAHRSKKHFEIINLHLEDTFISTDAFIKSFSATIKKFASFNACETIDIQKAQSNHLTEAIKQILFDS